jgi:general secretion pathway protein J
MREAGFTLLELLVSMTLLALLSLVLFGGFRFGTRAWDRSETSTAATSEIRRAQDIIAETLGRAYPEMQFSDPKNPHVFFEGNANEVTFLGPDGSGSGAMAVIHLAHEGDALVMIATPELARDTGAETKTRQLLDHVATFELAYFGAAKDTDSPRWFSSWSNVSRLPKLVRIRASLTTARPGWTEMIVTPRIAADASCTFDALTKFCQGR